MIRVENVRRLYGNFCAVDDISFSIGQGEIVGLLGHNGAGKTTIMKMITGFLEPTSGIIEINNLNLDESANDIQRQIGYLPENLPVYPEMSVMDYLIYCAQMRGIEESKQSRAAYTAIAKTQLQEKALAQISTLSRGFKQRVGVAQALIHNPKLLILDEPTNGLDPHQTQKMRELILNLAKDATVILSTHIMQEVDALCDRVIILESGKLAIDQPLINLQKVDAIEVVSDASLPDIQAAITKYKLNAVQTDAVGSKVSYIIAIEEAVNTDEICADIAHDLSKNNKKIFALSPRQQNLEKIFKTIHNKEETPHAP